MPGDVDALISELTDEMSRTYRALAAVAGLNLSDMMGIGYIRTSPEPATPSLVARHLGLSSGATAILLNRLEADGFIVRYAHPSDRRVTLLKLGPTAQGSKFHIYAQGRQRVHEKVLGQYSEAELAVVRRFLGDVVVALRERADELEHLKRTR